MIQQKELTSAVVVVVVVVVVLWPPPVVWRDVPPPPGQDHTACSARQSGFQGDRQRSYLYPESHL